MLFIEEQSNLKVDIKKAKKGWVLYSSGLLVCQGEEPDTCWMCYNL